LTLKVDVILGAEQRQYRRYWCGNDYAIEISISVPRGGMIVSSYELCTPLAWYPLLPCWLDSGDSCASRGPSVAHAH